MPVGQQCGFPRSEILLNSAMLLKNLDGLECGMCGKTESMEVAGTEEIFARQPPEARAIIRLLLARTSPGARYPSRGGKRDYDRLPVNIRLIC